MHVDIPKIDTARYVAREDGCREDCNAVAHAFREYGIVSVRCESVPQRLHDRFIETMFAYFRQPEEMKRRDEREAHQVGWTPGYIERPVDRRVRIAALPDGHKPQPVLGKDPKERWFHPVRLDPPPAETVFPVLNAEPVTPEGFPEWRAVMDAYGKAMLEAIFTVAEMAAIGFGARDDLFTSRMRRAPHLLAPTGTELMKYGRPGTVHAGVHDDLNMISAHGQANHPGLRVWLRDGTSMPVSIPHGWLLMQAGQQMECATGGEVHCGLHEVVATEELARRVADAAATGDEHPWRVSTTLFGHLDSDAVLEPLGPFADAPRARNYPPMLVGEQVAREIKRLQLA